MGRPNEIQDELLQHLVPCPIPFLDAGMNRIMIDLLYEECFVYSQ